jgi:O-acetyl-ADP-ribose deacetylase (regulator of RNase III)
MKAKVNKVTIQIMQADILTLSAAALVNTTDPNLSMPPVLASRAGADVLRECRDIGWCNVGDAVVTGGGKSGYEKIIHAVGPRWGEGAERGKLANATLRCLQLAEDEQLKSIAIPAISAGSLGYPLENCAKVMLAQIIDFTFEDLKSLRTVILCVETPVALQIFENEFQRQLLELKESGDAKVKV